MTARNGSSPTLDGCTVLPPMQPSTQPTAKPPPQRKPHHAKTRDRFALLNAFVDMTAGEQPRSGILVWIILNRDTRDGVARTSQADIARTSKRTVGRAIHDLQRRGLLRVIRRGELNRGPSHYEVKVA